MANNRKDLRTPTPTATVLFLLATYLPSSGVMGYSRGAPDTACGDLMPGHGLVTQTSPSPYTIAPGAATLEGGKRMLVTLQTSDNEKGFMGFLVQARNPDDESQVVGTFFTTDHSYITCGKGFNHIFNPIGDTICQIMKNIYTEVVPAATDLGLQLGKRRRITCSELCLNDCPEIFNRR